MKILFMVQVKTRSKRLITYSAREYFFLYDNIIYVKYFKVEKVVLWSSLISKVKQRLNIFTAVLSCVLIGLYLKLLIVSISLSLILHVIEIDVLYIWLLSVAIRDRRFEFIFFNLFLPSLWSVLFLVAKLPYYYKVRPYVSYV